MLCRFLEWLSRATLLLSLWFLAEVPAAAQCAMCYVSASASGSKAIHALKSGILILLIPTLAILTGIVIVGYRARHREFAEALPPREETGWEPDWALPSFPKADGAPLPR